MRDDLAVVNPNYKNDVTSEGEWIYPLPKLKQLYAASNTDKLFNYSKLSKWSAELPNLTSCRNAFKGIAGLTEWTVGFPALKGGTYLQIFETRYLKKFSGSLDNLTNGHMLFWYCTVLEEFSSDLPSLSTGGAMFHYTKLNKTSVLRILNTIPSYTSGSHQLDIGIHIDHKYDPEINFALKMADGNYEPLNLPIDEETGEFLEPTESKGWTLTIQWNGTVTENAYPSPQTTFSLRPQIITIYAKLGEIENPNGEKESFLDWGHYVTNWEENGYQEFSSLEEAYEHFNLEFPKETLDNPIE